MYQSAAKSNQQNAVQIGILAPLPVNWNVSGEFE
jgi:hypothetical protein